MYLNVDWREHRMWINESHQAWNENVTGPLNVTKYKELKERCCKWLWFNHLSDCDWRSWHSVQCPLGARLGDLWPGGLFSCKDIERHVWTENQKGQDNSVQHKVSRWAIFCAFFLTYLFCSRVSVKVSCRMMFDSYPFDEHTCKFQIGSCKCWMNQEQIDDWLAFSFSRLLPERYFDLHLSLHWSSQLRQTKEPPIPAAVLGTGGRRQNHGIGLG